MDGYAVRHPTSRPPRTRRRCTRPSWARSAPARRTALRDVARHGGQDHDRRAGAGECRHGRAPTVDRPRGRAGPDRPSADLRPARAPGRGDVQVGDVLVSGAPCSARATSACSRPSVAPPSRPPRPRVVVISTGSELRDPGTSLGHDSIYDGNSTSSPPRPGARARSPTASASFPTSPRAFLDALNDQLVRADVVVTAVACRRATTTWSGGARSAGHRLVRRVAMQPGKPRGFGRVGGTDAHLHAAGQPGVVVHLLRDVRAPALRKLMGRAPYSRPVTTARLTRPALARRAPAVRAGAVRRRPGRTRGDAGRRARFPPHR